MKRVMLKLSGEALSGKNGFGFDYKFIDSVVKQIKKIKSKTTQVLIMTGGGNFIRGKFLSGIDKYRADEIGMLSTCMNAIYLKSVFLNNGIKSKIYGTFSISDMVHVFDKDEANDALNNGEVVIFAGGTGHSYFTTDTGVVLRSVEMNCDELLLAKNIDGVYDSDPKINKKAKKYSKISLKEVIDKKLEVIDLSASTLAYDNKLKFRIFKLDEKDSIIKAINGKDFGTLIY